MSSFGRWWGRLGMLVGTVVLAVFVPVVAWASSGTGELVVEAARRRGSGFGVFGFLSLLCCLAVVVVIVLLVIRLTRRRR
ncbi:hypothetical protein HCA58_00580 [Micromonospora sp. HNM0581]|uniref:hypothetical protein n=1 Tax=Micromonospora sp. HNM0581 TaxID=2716341 RepID=UPI00146B587A|nr:hypothetical protein [Micromonospora sp. HNM0581]NLU76912.1 hypothetical protein [Micromonospora sp. HNM0581]